MAGTVGLARPLTLKPVVVNDPVRPVMIEVLVTMLRRLGPTRVKDALTLLQPGFSDRSKAELAIKYARSLGLVVDKGADVIAVAPELASDRTLDMRRLIRERVFYTPDLKEAHDSELFGLESFFYAWLTSSEERGEIYHRMSGELDSAFRREFELGNTEGMNDVKLRAFWDWVDYARLGRRFGDDLGFVCDPTPALGDAFDASWRDDETEADARELLNRLGSVLSVLDGGEVFARADRGRPRPHASVALSRGLLALHDAEKIRLIPASDAPSALKLAQGIVSGFKQVSRIERLA